MIKLFALALLSYSTTATLCDKPLYHALLLDGSHFFRSHIGEPPKSILSDIHSVNTESQFAIYSFTDKPLRSDNFIIGSKNDYCLRAHKTMQNLSEKCFDLAFHQFVNGKGDYSSGDEKQSVFDALYRLIEIIGDNDDYKVITLITNAKSHEPGDLKKLINNDITNRVSNKSIKEYANAKCSSSDYFSSSDVVQAMADKQVSLILMSPKEEIVKYYYDTFQNKAKEIDRSIAFLAYPLDENLSDLTDQFQIALLEFVSTVCDNGYPTGSPNEDTSTEPHIVPSIVPIPTLPPN